MVVTESKALQLISNEELAGRIPSFHVLHQTYLRTKREVSQKTGCGSCSLSEPEFASLKEKALAHIRHASDVDIEALKNHLVVNELVFYDVTGGVRQKVIR
jgi:hypothetical protein